MLRLVACPILYIMYVCIFACEPEIYYLESKIVDKEISEIMSQQFKAAPVITMKAESYHMEGTKDDSYKSVSHSEEEQVNYYSFKDISSLISLNIPENKDIFFIKLHIIKEINFADPISYYDYANQKISLYQRSKYKDRDIDYTEKREYTDYNEYNLVSVNGKDSLFYSKKVYFLFVFLTLGIVYHLILQFSFHKETVIIKKIVSTRYNLLDHEHSLKYEALKPSLSIHSKIFKYDEQDTGATYEENKMGTPSIEELNKAQCYQNLIPNFFKSNTEDISYVNETPNTPDIKINNNCVSNNLEFETKPTENLITQ